MGDSSVILRVRSKNPEWEEVCAGNEDEKFLQNHGLTLDYTTHKELIKYMLGNGHAVRSVVFAGGLDEQEAIDGSLWALDRGWSREALTRVVITSDLCVASCVAERRGAKVLLNASKQSDAQKLGYGYYPDSLTLLSVFGVVLTPAKKRALRSTGDFDE